MTVSSGAATPLVGVSATDTLNGAPGASRASDLGHSGATGSNTPQGARHMVAVTVALSEPLDAAPLDWAETIAANLRHLYRNTTVEVIDSWRVDQ